MRVSFRFLSFLLVLLLLMPFTQAESILKLQNQIEGHELEYVQRFSGHAIPEEANRNIFEAKIGSWQSSETPDKKGAALLLVVSLWERELMRLYDLKFFKDGTLYSLHTTDYIANNLHNGDYAPADTLYLTDEASQLEAAQEGLTDYLEQLFNSATEEYVTIEVESVYSEPFFVMKEGKMETLAAAHVMFTLAIKKDCDWAKTGQTYGILWNLAYNELDSIWAHQ